MISRYGGTWCCSGNIGENLLSAVWRLQKSEVVELVGPRERNGRLGDQRVFLDVNVIERWATRFNFETPANIAVNSLNLRRTISSSVIIVHTIMPPRNKSATVVAPTDGSVNGSGTNKNGSSRSVSHSSSSAVTPYGTNGAPSSASSSAAASRSSSKVGGLARVVQKPFKPSKTEEEIGQAIARKTKRLDTAEVEKLVAMQMGNSDGEEDESETAGDGSATTSDGTGGKKLKTKETLQESSYGGEPSASRSFATPHSDESEEERAERLAKEAQMEEERIDKLKKTIEQLIASVPTAEVLEPQVLARGDKTDDCGEATVYVF